MNKNLYFIITILAIVIGWWFVWNARDGGMESGTQTAPETETAEAAEAAEAEEETAAAGEDPAGAAGAIPPPGDVAGIPEDALVTDEGVAIRMLEDGDGETYPGLEDDIIVHYTGWQTDGTMFDSSVLRGEPNRFPLGRLIDGWQIALPKISEGGKALIWIPGDLAYDKRADRPDAPKGMLVFEVELIKVVEN